jgi:heme A synthase
MIFLKASVYHAFLAQAEFGMLVALTLMLSRAWAEPIQGAGAGSALATLTTVMVYIQIVLGALVRHTEGAALAMPSFPLPLLPNAYTTTAILQLVHRLGAVMVAAAVVSTLLVVFKHHRTEMRLVRPAAAMTVMTAIQILLGASIIWTGREVDYLPTAHVAVGSLIVACSLALTLQARRLLRVPQSVGA